MGRGKGKTKESKLLYEIIVGIVFIILALTSYYKNTQETNANDTTTNIIPVTAEETQNVELTGDNRIQIHFFDVGQADSILLVSEDETMLIDAGTNEAATTVVNDIKNLGIKKIDYLVGTHPHEDHIGGLDSVIKNFEIGTIYMPKIQANTKTFEDVLDAAKDKNLKITAPNVGDKIKVGNIECEVMTCDTELAKENNNLNLSSIVIRATFGEQSYLFMGDAETENEKSRQWPQTNVLKVGHHGSNTSSSAGFLKQVQPQIAIIQVGKDNKYDHPKQVTLDKLNKLGTIIYRTDLNKNILLESDGINNKISFY